MAVVTNVEGRLDALVDQFPDFLAREGLDPSVCVLATRLACLAFAQEGIKASPLPVELHGFSERYAQAVHRGEIGPEIEPTEEIVARLKAEGAHMIHIAAPPPGIESRTPNGRLGYGGHLVCLVERRWVLDLTTHQMNRPSKGMFFTPHRFRATPEFMSGEPFTVHSGTALATYVRATDNTFAAAPAWTTPRGDHRLVRALVQILRASAR